MQIGQQTGISQSQEIFVIYLSFQRRVSKIIGNLFTSFFQIGQPFLIYHTEVENLGICLYFTLRFVRGLARSPQTIAVLNCEKVIIIIIAIVIIAMIIVLQLFVTVCY